MLIKRIPTDTSQIDLSRQAENDITVIQWDVSAWVDCFGAGTCSLHYKRPSDSAAHLSGNTTFENGILTWTVSETDLQFAGIGEIQLHYVAGEYIKKSGIIPVKINRSLDSSAEVPSVWQPVLDRVQEAVQNAEESAETAEASAESIENMVVSASVDSETGIPEVEVTKEIIEGIMHLQIDFKNLKGADGAITFVVVEELPTEDIHDNWIYLVRIDDEESEDHYKEWMHIQGEWNPIGTAQIDLSNYATKEDLAEKANTDDVTEALAEKANASEVETELADKISKTEVYDDLQKDSICQTIGAMRVGSASGGLTTRTLSAADNPTASSAVWTESVQELMVSMLFNRKLDIDTDNVLFIVAKFNHYPYDYTVIGQINAITVMQYQTQITIQVPNFKPMSWTSSSNNISMTIVYDK